MILCTDCQLDLSMLRELPSILSNIIFKEPFQILFWQEFLNAGYNTPHKSFFKSYLHPLRTTTTKLSKDIFLTSLNTECQFISDKPLPQGRNRTEGSSKPCKHILLTGLLVDIIERREMIFNVTKNSSDKTKRKSSKSYYSSLLIPPSLQSQLRSLNNLQRLQALNLPSQYLNQL